MEHLYQLLFRYPLLSLAQGAFTIWMLVDASRRRPDWFWYWLILVFQPIGPWAYFFAFKAGDWQGLQGLPWFHRRVSLEELRYQVQQNSTLTNHLALAERLVERGEHAEAVPHLEAARAREPDHSQVLYLLAQCHAEQGHPELAIPLLEHVASKDPRWSDYKVWRLLVAQRARVEDRPGALTACRELVRLSPTLEHRCLLAEHLLDQGKTQEARLLLEQALQDHQFAPNLVRRRNRRWASRARSLQKRAVAS
jgi:hypothetical protein